MFSGYYNGKLFDVAIAHMSDLLLCSHSLNQPENYCTTNHGTVYHYHHGPVDEAVNNHWSGSTGMDY